ncbi:hypothetical protein EX30DRAFT_395625 [Ascodesmis nigricans]|uniref:Uncharacterized protein n=1 Tax=Ascodesmis nigricans TaxID=341454 RepID=A0A4V3SIV7_9PEZI|nr:hypothetical protein EX30DRAFT_395625 [Ascodesmis nigricans]
MSSHSPIGTSVPDLAALPSTREDAITTLREYNQAGTGNNIPNAKRALRCFLEEPGVFRQESSEDKLSEETTNRIKQLEEFLVSVTNNEDKLNVRAVIEAYKARTLELEDRQVAVFWGGQQKEGPVDEECCTHTVEEKVRIWASESPTGRLWVERLRPLPQRMTAIAIPLSNNRSYRDWTGSQGLDWAPETELGAWD